MIITLQLDPASLRTVQRLSGMGQAITEACSKGLQKGVKIAAGAVVRDFLSGQSLSRRTGRLAGSIDGWMAGDLEGVIGVREGSPVDKYKWLLTDEQHLIEPTGGRKCLTIPIGEALQGSGAAKYESAANAEAELGVKLFRPKGTNVLGYKVGKKGKFRPLFALVKSVFVQGSGALADGVLENVDNMTDAISAEIDTAINSK